MPKTTQFSDLSLPKAILSAVDALGFTEATPIQQESIPILLEGHNLLAQAQTGTGKTAAFALPILSKLDINLSSPQALVVAPTREIAIQIAKAVESYAKHMDNVRVACIYGGQEYRPQLTALRRGPHIVVGTPGRLMDHMRKGSLNVNKITTVILDEADEMLKMGFIDAVEWILEQMEQQHQTALFSATMSMPIQKIAERYIKPAKKITIKNKQVTVDRIEQSVVRSNRKEKLTNLTRLLEVEAFDAAIIFVQTKTATTELAQLLQKQGLKATALNGDMKQNLREKVLRQIHSGAIDIIVATDVAARGIDVERITHVINYDIPFDVESYIHRIGRTGRAGRSGKALLFVSPRETRLLREIERATNKSIKDYIKPTQQDIAKIRSEKLLETVTSALHKRKEMAPYRQMVEHVLAETNRDPLELATALVYLNQKAQFAPLPKSDDTADPHDSVPKRKKGKFVNAKAKPRAKGKRKVVLKLKKKPGKANKKLSGVPPKSTGRKKVRQA